jgi:hypothetical protein
MPLEYTTGYDSIKCLIASARLNASSNVTYFKKNYNGVVKSVESFANTSILVQLGPWVPTTTDTIYFFNSNTINYGYMNAMIILGFRH